MPLIEVHANTQKDAINNGNRRSSNVKNKRKRHVSLKVLRQMSTSKSNKDKSSTCEKCGFYNHPTTKCHTRFVLELHVM
jgi:lipopolysaccharide biosynthesis regulator YciM